MFGKVLTFVHRFQTRELIKSIQYEEIIYHTSRACFANNGFCK